MQYSNSDKLLLKQNKCPVLSKITLLNDNTVFTEDDYISDWEYKDFRYVPNNGFIGQFVERTLDGKFKNIPDNKIFENQEINMQLGIVDTSDNDSTTWYDYGNFLITKVQKEDTTGNYKFESADYTKKFNKVYDSTSTYPTIALDLANDACTQAGVTLDTNGYCDVYVVSEDGLPAGSYKFHIGSYYYKFATSENLAFNDTLSYISSTNKIILKKVRNNVVTRSEIAFTRNTSAGSNTLLETKHLPYVNFANYDFVVKDNQYDSDATCRKVMQDVAKLGYTWARVGVDNKVHFDFTPKATNSVDTYDQLTIDEYYISKKSDLAFGPVNKVLIGMADIDGENMYETSQDYTEATECAIKIWDNNLTNTESLRAIALNGCERLFGITYTPITIDTIGHPWLEGDELIKLTNVDNEVIYTYPFNRTIKYAGYIKGTLASETSTAQNTKYEYKSDIISAVKKTTIEVDKQNQTITALASDVSENASNISALNITVNGIEQRVTSVESTEVVGVTNEYAVNTDPANPPAESSSAWSTTKPTRGEGQYVWARIKSTYKNGNVTYSDPVNTTGDKGDPGQAGDDGASVDTITEYYAVSDSNTTPPSTWTTDLSTIELTHTNRYLWNYEVITYTEGKQSTETGKKVIGVYGDTGDPADPAIMYHNVKGTSIDTTDAGNLELKSINEIDGDTSQVQTTLGKNLFDNTKALANSTSCTVQINGNNIVATRTVGAPGTSMASYSMKVEKNTNYVVSGTAIVENTDLTGGCLFLVRTLSNGGTVISNSQQLNINITSEQQLSLSFNSGNYTEVFLWFYVDSANPEASATGTRKVTYKNIQFEKGSSPTTYEAFVPNSPTPDYSSVAETATGLQTIQISGKNKLDTNKMIVFQPTTASTWWWIDGLPATDQSTLFYKVEAGKTYTFSIKEKTNWTQIQGIYRINGVDSQAFLMNNTSTKTTFTPTITTELYVRGVVSQANTNTYCICQLEEGSDATDFEEFTGGEYDVDLGKNLLDDSTIKRTISTTSAFSITITDVKFEAGTYLMGCFVDGQLVSTNNIYSLSFRNSSDTSIVSTAYPNRPVIITREQAKKITKLLVYFNNNFSSTYNGKAITGFMIVRGPKLGDYRPHFTPIELCKIENYKDSIYRGKYENLANIADIKIGKTWQNSNNTNRATILWIPVEQGEEYTLTGTYTSSDITQIRGVLNKGEGQNSNSVVTGTFVVPEGWTHISIEVMAGTTFTSAMLNGVQIMLCKGKNTMFEPYGGKDKWLLRKEIDKIIVDGNQSINAPSGMFPLYFLYTNQWAGMKYLRGGWCDAFKYVHNDNITANSSASGTLEDNQMCFRMGDARDRVYFKASQFANTTEVNTYFRNNNTKLYYALENPRCEIITNEALINDLNVLEKVKLNEGINSISISGTIPIYLDLDYWTWYKGETGKGVGTIVEEYALSTSSTEVTGTWSTTAPTMTPTNKYLWNRTTTTFENPTTVVTSDPLLIGVYGLTGDTGKGIASVTELYYVSNSSTVPQKPTEPVTTSNVLSYNTWNKQCPSYTTTYKYFYTCSEVEYDTDPTTYSWSNVTQNQGLAISNQNAYDAKNKVDNLKINVGNLWFNGQDMSSVNKEQWDNSFSGLSTTDLPDCNKATFKFRGGGPTKYFVPYNNTATYEVGLWLKAYDTSSSTRNYPSIIPYDMDKNQINYYQVRMNPSTDTVLSQDLVAGDTVVHAQDLSQWSTIANNYLIYVGIYNYKSSTGYTYKDYTRTTLQFADYGQDKTQFINKTNNTITLQTAYTGETIPAGTSISQNMAGSGYIYPFGSLLPSQLTNWTEKTLRFDHTLDKRLEEASYLKFHTYNAVVWYFYPYLYDVTDEEGRNAISNQLSSYVTTETYTAGLANTAEELKSWSRGELVTTTDFGTYQQTVEGQLSQKAGVTQITSTATAIVNQAMGIDENGNAIEGGVTNILSKVDETFTFDTNGLTIARGGNSIYLQLQNDELAFRTDNTDSGKKAYMSSNAFVLDQLSELRLGNFAFVVRANGSVDFKKVK